VTAEGASRGPRLTLERASRSSSSECSLNGSRFSLTVPENRTASGRQLALAPKQSAHLVGYM